MRKLKVLTYHEGGEVTGVDVVLRVLNPTGATEAEYEGDPLDAAWELSEDYELVPRTFESQGREVPRA